VNFVIFCGHRSSAEGSEARKDLPRRGAKKKAKKEKSKKLLRGAGNGNAEKN
jgi:hypothetical protein